MASQPSFETQDLMSIFSHAGVPHAPYHVAAPQIAVLYKMGFGEHLGTYLGHQLLHESLSDY
jgi:hypothetical protein